MDLTSPVDVTNIVASWGDSEGVISVAHRGQFEFCRCFGVAGLVTDRQLVEPVEILHRVERNLRTSLDFYNVQFPGRELAEIKLHGTGSRALTDELSPTDISVDCENPYVGQIPDEKTSSRFWNDCGNEYILCSGAARLKSERYLLPLSVERLLVSRKMRSLSRILSFSAAVALVLLVLALWIEHTSRSKAVNLIGQTITKIETSPEYLHALSLTEELSQKRALKSRLQPPHPWVADMLKGISVSVPPEISFNNMDLKRRASASSAVEIRIEGHYYGSIKSTEARLAELSENLRDHIGFEQTNLDRVSERLERNRKRSNFALTGQAGIN